MSQSNDFKINLHHRMIARKLEQLEKKKITRLIINMPPRHGKSYLCSQFFPAWFMGRSPGAQVISASYGQALATDFGRQVRNLMISDQYKYIFPRVRVADDSKSQSKFSTHNGGHYFAVGRGGSITGRGGHLIVIDDLLKNEMEARSEHIRNGMKEWYKNTLYTRLMPGGVIIVINTRWHLDDLCGWLLRESSDDWEVLNLPAINEKGHALWKEFFPVSQLKRIKNEIGSQAFEALYQQNPMQQEGNVVKTEWLKHWVKLPARFDEWIQSWDLTFKGSKNGDWVVGQVWGRFRQTYYLIDQVRGRWDFSETVQQVKQLSMRYPKSVKKIIEDKANGPALVSHLKQEIHGFKLWNPRSDKMSRLQSVTPILESGNVLLPPRDKPWVRGLVDELISFPVAKHDDQVDALTQALINLKPNTGSSFAASGQSFGF
jgi:predicted phage terminase large subunit-like protein